MPLAISPRSTFENGEKLKVIFTIGAASSTKETYPWLLSSRVGQDVDPGLCWICRQINFAYLLDNPSEEVLIDNCTELQGKNAVEAFLEGISLGTMANIQERGGLVSSDDSRANEPRGCPFCALVYGLACDFFPDGPGSDGSNNNSLADSDVVASTTVVLNSFVRGPSRSHRTRERLGSTPSTVQLSIYLSPDPQPLDFDILSWFNGERPDVPKIQRLLENFSAEDEEVSLRGRPTEEVVDFGMLKKWIARCTETQTGEQPETARKPLARIRLIDVEKGCIVGPWNEAPSYVALSYVWGKSKSTMLLAENQETLQKPGTICLDDRAIPRTIRDTMRACQLLLERYLWVDSLCILQDSPEKRIDIEQMDAIYGKAKLTIIAVGGSDADFGLPGVTPGSREEMQQKVKAGDVLLGNVLPGLKQTVNSSYWNTRGWTYQERLLSPRRLYFTPTQVFLECQHGMNKEDDLLDCHEDITSDAMDENMPALDFGNPYRILQADRLNLSVYERIVHEYTVRNLTYDGDILNAFQGVASVLQRNLFRNSPIAFGIPVCLLEVSLVWRPARQLHRRLRPNSQGNEAQELYFPSWSWMGWKGQVRVDATGNFSESLRSCVQWRAVGDPATILGQERTGRPPPAWPEWPLWERHVVFGFDIYYNLKSDQSKQRFCHPISEWHQGDLVPVDLSTGHLHLKGQVAKLRVSGEHTGRWDQDWKCNTGSHTESCCPLWVYDSSDSRCGMVYMDGNTFLSTDFSVPPQGFDFIKLSQKPLLRTSEPGSNAASQTVDNVDESAAGTEGEGVDPEDSWFDSKYNAATDRCLYNVLMVRWKDHVAYRMAVGEVHIQAFDDAGPEWIDIVLG